MSAFEEFQALSADFLVHADEARRLAATAVRDALDGISFTPVQLSLLQSYATPTLREDFARADTQGGAERQTTIRAALAHAFQDPVEKCAGTLKRYAAHIADPRGESAEDLHLEEEAMVENSAAVGVMLHELAWNYRLILRNPPPACAVLLQDYEVRFAPEFSRLSTAMAQDFKLGRLDQIAGDFQTRMKAEGLEVPRQPYALVTQGKEHLHRLPRAFTA